MVQVKICGICDAAGATAAVEAGADLIGFHFCSSQRRVTPEEAKAIVESSSTRTRTRSGRFRTSWALTCCSSTVRNCPASMWAVR